MDDPRTLCFESEADLLDIKATHSACKGMDGVFHLASLCLGHCQDDPRKGYDINVTGTFNILEASGVNDVKRVMCASSSSIYGNAVYTPMDEAHPFMNQNFYGATKIAGEAIVNAFHHTHGLDYLNFRFMNVYGPRQDYEGVYVAVIMKVIDRIIQGRPPIIYGDGSQAFDFVFVEDVCRSLLLGMESDLTTESYNISSGNQTSIHALTVMISELLGSDLPFEYRDQDDRGLVVNRVGSTEKAAKQLRFKTATELKDGIREVISWRTKSHH